MKTDAHICDICGAPALLRTAATEASPELDRCEACAMATDAPSVAWYGDQEPEASIVLTEQDKSLLHRAGLSCLKTGPWDGLNEASIARCDHLVSQGLLGFNETTRMYFLTELGADHV